MKTAVIDVDHIFYLALSGQKILDAWGMPILDEGGHFTYRPRTFEESCKVADSYINNLLKVTGCDSYVGFFSGSSWSRKKINLEYKANRTGTEPLPNMGLMQSYLADTYHFEWLGNSKQQADLFNCIWETDDYVASYAKNNPGSFIVSPDKDLIGLEGTHYNPYKNEWVTVTEAEAEINFWKSMICGDTADNIKGLPGKGKKAFEAIKQTAEMINVELSVMIFRAYSEYYKDDTQAVLEFYKNFFTLKIKTTLDTSLFTPTDWLAAETEDPNFFI